MVAAISRAVSSIAASVRPGRDGAQVPHKLEDDDGTATVSLWQPHHHPSVPYFFLRRFLRVLPVVSGLRYRSSASMSSSKGACWCTVPSSFI